MILKWKEVEPPMLISAAGAIQQGFAQYYTDLLVVVEFVSDHFGKCAVCRPYDEVFCQMLEKARVESVERFSDYADFFNVIDSFKSMFSWVGVVRDDGDII